jgi:hypothetical protein
VAEDPADLRDVEAQVDDQVAGERVAQVVEAQPRPAAILQGGMPRRPGRRAPLRVAFPSGMSRTAARVSGATRVGGEP